MFIHDWAIFNVIKWTEMNSKQESFSSPTELKFWFENSRKVIEKFVDQQLVIELLRVLTSISSNQFGGSTL